MIMANVLLFLIFLAIWRIGDEMSKGKQEGNHEKKTTKQKH